MVENTETEVVLIRELPVNSLVVVQTRNSQYEILVLEPINSIIALVRTKEKWGSEPWGKGWFQGSINEGIEDIGAIHVGMRMLIYGIPTHESWRFDTSPVVSVNIVDNPSRVEEILHELSTLV